MSLDKKIKEQLRNYKIQPSAKPWERIEESLEAKQKAKPWFVYVRWAAAASIIFIAVSYVYWKPSENDNLELVDTKNNIEVPQQNSIIQPQNSEAETQTIIVDKEKNSYKLILKNTNSNQSEQQSFVKNDELPILQTTASQSIDKQPIRRPVESMIATLQPKIQTFDTQYNIPDQLNLPVISTELTESGNSYMKWKRFFMEEFNEESDSTITEKALNLANKKSVAFMKNNWKPAVAKWVKLKKGF